MSGSVAVTGARGYSGKYIAEQLLRRGYDVRTLTNSPSRRDPFAGRIRGQPLAFARPERLRESLQGVDVLVNTYWVRFNYGGFSFREAVANTKVLFSAAAQAGVGRIVHVSITNPDRQSQLPYFRGKAELESALQATGIPYTIVRPAVLYGGEDILINNIAWALRRLPVFGVFGNGSYRLRPIHVEDFAELIVEEVEGTGTRVVDAVGQERFSYRELVCELCRILGLRRPVIGIPPRLGYAMGRLIGWLMRDVFITWDEVVGLMEGRLDVDGPGVGKTQLLDWAAAHAHTLGRHYASELRRRRDRTVDYAASR